MFEQLPPSVRKHHRADRDAAHRDPPRRPRTTGKETQRLSLDLGGGTTSTLSSVVAPARPAGVADRRHSVQYVLARRWRRCGRRQRDEVDQGGPADPGRAQARLRPTGHRLGVRQVVVGSVGTGGNTRAAVWVSARPGQPFLPVPETPAFDAPATTPGLLRRGWSRDGHRYGRGAGPIRRRHGRRQGDHVVLDRRPAMAAPERGRQRGRPGPQVRSSTTSLSTPAGVFAGGSDTTGTGLSAALWYSSDGIHWATVRDSVTSPFRLGDQVITSLVSIGAYGELGTRDARPERAAGGGGGTDGLVVAASVVDLAERFLLEPDVGELPT